MSEISIEDIQSYIQGKERHAVMTVKDINDPDYKSMRNFVLDINPHAEDYMKYEVKGSSSGISGKRQYGYDKSRVDGRMIRRRRQN